MAKKAFVHAYMAGNLGDDVMVRILCERYPNVTFLLFADASYKERYKDIKNLKIYAPSDRLVQKVDHLVAKYKKAGKGMWKLLVKLSDVTVHIGGSVFVQHEDNFKPAYDLDYDLRSRSKKMYVIGANFGPYTSKEYYDVYKELFKRYDGICFRDHYSKGMFETYENIKYAPDVVFNYKMPSDVKEEKEVLFSVIEMEARGGKYSISQYGEEYYRTVAALADRYAEKGYKINMVSFCRMQGDESAIEKITSLMAEEHRDNVGKVLYDQNEKEVMNAFARAEIVVGTRFHSIILGWLAGKKVLPIVYDHKIRNILKDNEIKLYLEMKELLDMDREKVNEIADQIAQGAPFDASGLIDEAEVQFEALDKFLK